ncbi:MAG: hypothetical protein JNM39_17630 [Bdellovibrionaceae bacterium]|nr:hypothetical protein [Pseudobdellovibrionaceae bacterium]
MKKIVKKLRSYRRGGLQRLGFWLGLMLAQGAPLGLFVHLYFFGPRKTDDFLSHMTDSWTLHLPIYLYVWIGTSLYFSLFGWAAGKLVGNWFKDLQRSESSLSLFSKFDQLNRKMTTNLQTQFRNPVASLLEFKEGLELGFFGAFTPEQHETIKSFLQDIVDLHNNVETPVDGSEDHSSSLDFLRPLAKTFHAKVNFESLGITVRFEKHLLEAAFAELLTEISGVRRQKLLIRISQTSALIPGGSNYAMSDYATIEFDCLKKKNTGPSWMIAGFILEWHGAVLSETERGYRLLIPLSKQVDKKGLAA